MKFKYILLDWDGCLVNTLPVWFQGMKEGLLEFGIHAGDTDLKKGFQTWNGFLEMGVTDVALFTQKVYEYVMGCSEGIEFNEGVPQLLKHIKDNHLKAAIVTSTETSQVLPVLERLDAKHFFDCIIGRQDVQNLKPDSEPIEKAMHLIGGEKKKAVMVGDSAVDIQAGKNAGISTVWYSTPVTRKFHLNHTTVRIDPDITISHMGELQNMI